MSRHKKTISNMIRESCFLIEFLTQRKERNKIQKLTKAFEILQKFFMNMLFALCETFRSFIYSVMRFDCHDYVGTV